ncbi:hypothetical protein QQF64_004911, partial [Cirrhinus molitorella]
ALLCFHGKSRPCPALPLLWPPWSFSLFTLALTHPFTRGLKSSLHPTRQTKPPVRRQTGTGRPLNPAIFQEKVGRYQKDIPK